MPELSWAAAVKQALYARTQVLGESITTLKIWRDRLAVIEGGILGAEGALS